MENTNKTKQKYNQKKEKNILKKRNVLILEQERTERSERKRTQCPTLDKYEMSVMFLKY